MSRRLKKILFISRTRQEYTNILKSMFLSLVEMNFYVKEIDITQNPDFVINPNNYSGGNGPVQVNYNKIKHEVESFKPDMIMLVAGGLCFSKGVSDYLKREGIITLGITLSDPDVLTTVKKYANRFTYHTTNATKALEMYRKLGLKNTYYLPFGIDSRFFVPTKVYHKYKSDVAIIGHFRPERKILTEELKKRFDTKIYGVGWPYKDVYPVDYPEWLKVVSSSKIIIDFPKTGKGYNNVKVRLFEVTAAGTLLVTQEIDEISNFFEYGKEIVGYKNYDDLYEKIQYYLDNEDERKKIARNAQIRCAHEHTWRRRFIKLFKEIGFR